MRVRIAQATSTNPSRLSEFGCDSSSLDTILDDLRSSSETLVGPDDNEGLTSGERRVLDKIGETLARLGRNKRVGLGVKEKQEFVRVWTRSRKRL